MTTNELLQNIAILTGIITAIATPVTIHVTSKAKAKKLKADRDYEIEVIKARENSVGATKIKEIEEQFETVRDDIEKINKVSQDEKRENSYVLKLYEELKQDYWKLMELVREILKGSNNNAK